MSARHIRKQGFTLVEILIVVVILGILAAIVIPQFTSASETAKASSLISQLQTIRSQLELYQVQHNGVYPQRTTLPTNAGTFWGQFSKYSESDGTCHDTKPTDGTIVYGPYMQKPPSNPLAISSLTDNTSVGAEDATAGAAWQYDEETGKIKAILDDSITTEKAKDMGLDIVNDVVITAS